MPLPEEVKKAIDIIDNYKESISTLLSKKVFICICCKKNEVKAFYAELLHPLELDTGLWEGGKVQKITFGFGSVRDMETFFIAICDECISGLEKEGLAISHKEISDRLEEIDNNYELYKF